MKVTSPEVDARRALFLFSAPIEYVMLKCAAVGPSTAHGTGG
jgi:hypothetical protein